MRTAWQVVMVAGLTGAAALVWPSHAGGGQARPIALAHPAALEGPLSFEPNRGQAEQRVKFLARGPGYTLFLTPDAAVLAFVHLASAEDLHGGNTLAMTLVGANPASSAAGVHELPGKNSYFLGTDARNWRLEIPTFAGIQFQKIYPDIDLTYQGSQGRLEYAFVVAPAADPGHIQVEISGSRSARLNASGDVIAQAAGARICFRRPVAYQEANGRRNFIEAHYLLKDNHVSLVVSAYDRTRPLCVDPVLNYTPMEAL